MIRSDGIGSRSRFVDFVAFSTPNRHPLRRKMLYSSAGVCHARRRLPLSGEPRADDIEAIVAEEDLVIHEEGGNAEDATLGGAAVVPLETLVQLRRGGPGPE